MSTAIALIVYVAAAFFDGSEPRFAVFTEKEACEQAVERVRAGGTFVTDCTPVELKAPKNGK